MGKSAIEYFFGDEYAQSNSSYCYYLLISLLSFAIGIVFLTYDKYILPFFN